MSNMENFTIIQNDDRNSWFVKKITCHLQYFSELWLSLSNNQELYCYLFIKCQSFTPSVSQSSPKYSLEWVTTLAGSVVLHNILKLLDAILFWEQQHAVPAHSAAQNRSSHFYTASPRSSVLITVGVDTRYCSTAPCLNTYKHLHYIHLYDI